MSVAKTIAKNEIHWPDSENSMSVEISSNKHNIRNTTVGHIRLGE